MRRFVSDWFAAARFIAKKHVLAADTGETLLALWQLALLGDDSISSLRLFAFGLLYYWTLSTMSAPNNTVT